MIRALRERIGLFFILRDRTFHTYRLGVWIEDYRCELCGEKSYQNPCPECTRRADQS